MFEQIEEPKSTEAKYELPGGYLREVRDEETGEVKATLYNLVTLREMSGHEEDILANEKKPFVQRMHEIIGRCIVCLERCDEDGKIIDRIDDRRELMLSVNRMLMSDTMSLILRTRQVSLGDRFVFQIRCPDRSCRTISSKSFNLAKLEVVNMKGDPTKRVRTFVTSKGQEVVWHMITGAEEKKLDELAESAKKDRATQALMARVKTVDNEPATLAVLKDMSMKDRTKLRNEFDDEGGIDTKINVTCNSCGLAFEADIPMVGENFFSLSETSDD